MVSHSPSSSKILPSPALLPEIPLCLIAAAGNDQGTARLQLQAQEGSWWITQPGRSADIILRPGERISLGSNALLLTEPLTSFVPLGGAPVIVDDLETEVQSRWLTVPFCQAALSRRYFSVELRRLSRWENAVQALLWASSLIALSMFIEGLF